MLILIMKRKDDDNMKPAHILILLLAALASGCGADKSSAGAEARAIYEVIMNSTEVHPDVPRDADPESRRDLGLAFMFRDMAQQFQQLADEAESAGDPQHALISELSQTARDMSEEFQKAASNGDDYEYGEAGNVRLRKHQRNLRSILDRLDPK